MGAYTETLGLLHAQESNHWAIGDAIVREVRTASDWQALDLALTNADLDYKVSTLRAYARVAAAFPKADRVLGVSFAAHQAALTVGKRANPGDMITRAQAANGRVTRDGVLAEVRKVKNRTKANTANAVAAFRDLARGVAAILDLDEAELDALLQTVGAKQAGLAPQLVKDMTQASVKLGKAMTKAEARIKQEAAKRKASQPVARPRVPAAQPTTGAKTPKIGKLGQGRGEG